MVEEMYLEEVKVQEQNKSDENKASKSEQSEDNSSSKHDKSVSPENSKRGFNHPPPPQMTVSTTVSTSPSTTRINFQNQNPPGFTLINSSQMEGMTQFSPKKPRNNDRQQTSDVGFTLMGNPTDFMGSLGGYPIGEIGRFTTEQFQPQYSGNGVSLTLGLPHCDTITMSGAPQNFLPTQNIQHQQSNEFEPMNQQSSSHSASMYETMNIQNQKRFADFVA